MSEPVLYSIISEKRLPLGDLSSRWLLWGEFRFPHDSLNGGTFLVPSYDQSSFSLAIQNRRYSGPFANSTLPSETDVESLLSLGSHLEEFVEARETGGRWLATPPIEPSISEAAQLLPLEEQVISDLPALEEVFARPRSDIETEEESILVSRARRLSKKAPGYLAAHSEDWERVGLRGVIPKKLLSRIRVENLAIYENCLMVRLVDNLVVHTGRRIEKLKKILRSYEESCDMGKDLIGTRFRRDRIATIWGMLFEESVGGEWIRENLRRLEQMYFELLGLKNFQLYRVIPRDAKVPRDLKNSNILSNDPLYRRGAGLWLAWRKKDRETELSAEEQSERQQSVCRFMELFGVLLCLHALNILYPGIKDWIESRPIHPGVRFDADRFSRKFTFEWRRTGEVVLACGDFQLRIVSVPANLAGVPTPEDARMLVDSFAPASSNRKRWTLLLHLEDVGGGRETIRCFNSVGNEADPDIPLPERLMIFGVSPLSIGSGEKVGRALRWFFAMVDLADYPHAFTTSGTVECLEREIRSQAEWLKKEDSKRFLICAPLSDKRLLIDAENEATRTVKKFESQLQELRQSKSGNKGREKDLKHKLDKAQKDLGQIEHAKSEINNGLEVVDRFTVCPVCHNEHQNAYFEARVRGCFRNECSECGSIWEIRKEDGEDGGRFPVLIPTGSLLMNEDDSVDRLYGADLLTLPSEIG